jgi:murein DD-endopeptidase MepM/ murein hydrolase activator NlpD|tara:strand:- start:8917 stop:12060 length:3144 start_codon:yes stop_codon:yes gene_type:complete
MSGRDAYTKISELSRGTAQASYSQSEARYREAMTRFNALDSEKRTLQRLLISAQSRSYGRSSTGSEADKRAYMRLRSEKQKNKTKLDNWNEKLTSDLTLLLTKNNKTRNSAANVTEDMTGAFANLRNKQISEEGRAEQFVKKMDSNLANLNFLGKTAKKAPTDSGLFFAYKNFIDEINDNTEISDNLKSNILNKIQNRFVEKAREFFPDQSQQITDDYNIDEFISYFYPYTTDQVKTIPSDADRLGLLLPKTKARPKATKEDKLFQIAEQKAFPELYGGVSATTTLSDADTKRIEAIKGELKKVEEQQKLLLRSLPERTSQSMLALLNHPIYPSPGFRGAIGFTGSFADFIPEMPERKEQASDIQFSPAADQIVVDESQADPDIEFKQNRLDLELANEEEDDLDDIGLGRQIAASGLTPGKPAESFGNPGVPVIRAIVRRFEQASNNESKIDPIELVESFNSLPEEVRRKFPKDFILGLVAIKETENAAKTNFPAIRKQRLKNLLLATKGRIGFDGRRVSEYVQDINLEDPDLLAKNIELMNFLSHPDSLGEDNVRSEKDADNIRERVLGFSGSQLLVQSESDNLEDTINDILNQAKLASLNIERTESPSGYDFDKRYGRYDLEIKTDPAPTGSPAETTPKGTLVATNRIGTRGEPPPDLPSDYKDFLGTSIATRFDPNAGENIGKTLSGTPAATAQSRTKRPPQVVASLEDETTSEPPVAPPPKVATAPPPPKRRAAPPPKVAAAPPPQPPSNISDERMGRNIQIYTQALNNIFDVTDARAELSGGKVQFSDDVTARLKILQSNLDLPDELARRVENSVLQKRTATESIEPDVSTAGGFKRAGGSNTPVDLRKPKTVENVNTGENGNPNAPKSQDELINIMAEGAEQDLMEPYAVPPTRPDREGRLVITDVYESRGGDHQGIDLRARKADDNTEVMSVMDGTVIMVQKDSVDSRGRFVEIMHDDGRISKYYHGESIPQKINIGTKVKAGDVIMFAGSSGRSTGPHLHFEIGTMSNGKFQPMDPMKALPDVFEKYSLSDDLLLKSTF